MYIEYFNTVGSKRILWVFEKVQSIENAEINWYCLSDEEDMQDCGEDYKSILHIPFNIIKTEHRDLSEIIQE